MLHPETQEPFDHRSRVKLIEHPIYPNCKWYDNGNVASDQVKFLEDPIIEYHFELRKD